VLIDDHWKDRCDEIKSRKCSNLLIPFVELTMAKELCLRNMKDLILSLSLWKKI
jgi:hypothetical protein